MKDKELRFTDEQIKLLEEIDRLEKLREDHKAIYLFLVQKRRDRKYGSYFCRY